MAKRVTILGAGESGTGAAMLARSRREEVFVSDFGVIAEKYKNELLNLSINFEQGGHNEHHILNSELIIKSPGISESAPIMKKIRRAEIPVVSEIEYAAQYSRAKFIAITGSNGKTTTTLLTWHLLKRLGLNVGLAGNIGDSLARLVIEDKYDYYVLELSSFQLDDMFDFRADIALLLNITPDHLDRYDYKFENYIRSKFRIANNMTKDNFFVYNADDKVIIDYLDMVEATRVPVALSGDHAYGAVVRDDKLVFSLSTGFEIPVSSLPVKGKHNQINAMAALTVASLLGRDPEKFEEAMADFVNAPHRLEYSGTLHGVEYVNDSKATNVDAVWYALDSCTRPVIWIAGGIDKGNDYSLLLDLVRVKVKALICLGKDNKPLRDAFDGLVPEIADADNMEGALRLATSYAEEGDMVLLSPACASFDLFNNYMDRGDQFKMVVKQLIEETNNKSL